MMNVITIAVVEMEYTISINTMIKIKVFIKLVIYTKTSTGAKSIMIAKHNLMRVRKTFIMLHGIIVVMIYKIIILLLYMQ